MARLRLLVILLVGVACDGSRRDDPPEADTQTESGPDGESGDTAADTADTAPDSAADTAVDADGDGSPSGEDCDDADATRFPGAEDLCDGIDQDCDGALQAPGSCGSWVPVDPDVLPAWEGNDADAAFTTYLGLPDLDQDGGEELVGMLYCETLGGETCAAAAVVLTGRPDRTHTPWDEASLGAWRYEDDVDKPWGGVQGAGDFDGDGWGDLWIPSLGEDDLLGGASYLVRGPPSSWPTDAPTLTDGSDAWWGQAELFDQYGWDFDAGGDLDGDGLPDAAVLAVGQKFDDRIGGSVAVILGRTDALPRGGSVAEEVIFWKAADGSEQDVDELRIGPDLDGDGARELLVAYDGGIGVVSGGALRTSSGARLADVVGIHAPEDLGEDYALTLPARGVDPGDLDGDGLDEVFFTSGVDDTTSPDWRRSCLTFASLGGAAAGEPLDALVRVELCQLASTSYGGVHASHDLDGDGVRDPLWIRERFPFGVDGPSSASCFVATSALPESGRVDDTDRSWCLGQGYVPATADLDGDGYPEVASIDPDAYEGAEDQGRVWVMAGFPIPWTDPDAW